MRKKRVINWMVILSILLTGCKQKKDTLQTLLPPLVKAEHIMYEYPDSALHILQEMQMPASSDKLQKATWALLLTQAKYKNYIEEVEDSTLINIAYNYFMQQEDAQRRAMVLYYKGILCKKAGKTEEAQKLYLAAIEEVEKLEDYQLAHLIYVELGEFYVFRELYEDAFKNFEKALRKAKAFVDRHPKQKPLITINSWNEWTETSYLMPCDMFGYGYLEAVKHVFVDSD